MKQSEIDRINVKLWGVLKLDGGKLTWLYQNDDEDIDDLWTRYCEDAEVVRAEVPNCEIIDLWNDNNSTGFTVNMNTMDKNMEQHLTPEFLESLKFLAKTYGWSGDYIEVGNFVQWAYEQAGKSITIDELSPFEDDETETNKRVVAAPVIAICSMCPFFRKGPDESTDGFDRGNDWICTHGVEEKVIAGFVEWHEESTVEIPEWCPVRR